MRKIVSIMHLSLDGYVADTNGSMGWIKHSEEMFNFVEKHIDQADTGIYGPVTFGMMAAHWPAELHNPDSTGHQRHHALWYDKAVKLVFSRKLESLDAPDATLVKGDLAYEISKLKSMQGKNMVLLGSQGLAHSFASLDLIDEYVLTIHPVILGDGKRMFEHGEPKQDLSLSETAFFKDGSIALHYVK